MRGAAGERMGAQENSASLAWLGLAWLGLAWLGLAWLGLAKSMPGSPVDFVQVFCILASIIPAKVFNSLQIAGNRAWGIPLILTWVMVLRLQLSFAPNQDCTKLKPMETTALDPRVSVFGSAAEEAAYNVWLSAELEKRAQDTRPGIPHDEVGANLAALLNQLQKKAA